jgi:hypothetical protein
VSFDVFLQAFEDGEVAQVDADLVTDLVDPLVVESVGGFVRIRTRDGGANLHGYDYPSTGLMLNHISGREVWQVLADVARSAGLVVMPVGASVCVPSGTMIFDLPIELRQDVAVIGSGADLLAVVAD